MCHHGYNQDILQYALQFCSIFCTLCLVKERRSVTVNKDGSVSTDTGAGILAFEAEHMQK